MVPASLVTCILREVLSGGEWDTHKDNFNIMKKNSLPKMDSAISALVTDLYQRGLDKRVLVIAHGEFGRTPQINKHQASDQLELYIRMDISHCYDVSYHQRGINISRSYVCI